MERQTTLDQEKLDISENLAILQSKLQDEKGKWMFWTEFYLRIIFIYIRIIFYNTLYSLIYWIAQSLQLNLQLKQSKTSSDIVKSEFSIYKEKATRILLVIPANDC